MVQKRVTSVKPAMEKLEHFLELGGTKKDITLLVISSIALIASVCIGEDFTAGEVAFIMQLGGLLEELTVARVDSDIAVDTADIALVDEKSRSCRTSSRSPSA